MYFSPSFYRGAAICSILSALTTLGLIFLPRLYTPVADFDARMALGNEPAYVLRSWIYLVHPFLVFAAALGLAARCRIHAAGAASLGLAGFAVWAATEAAQQALTKVALDRTWRGAWASADETARAVIREQVALYDIAWDAAYLLILLAFFVANVLMAAAVWRTAAASRVAPRIGRGVGIALWAAAALTLLLLLPEVGVSFTLPGTWWLYPLIQPAARALIGVWLWREADWEARPDKPRVIATAAS